ncbi:hypothetical protein SK128_009770 [Halocaridina rubra]|uniref:Uncharacterized protein n=1 Tax=Halocaridina rubra TaxID=373956 RepID=A0AAN8X2K6_HALRR
MTSNQGGYQQVVVVPTVAQQPQTRSDFLRQGVSIGGLALGLPCVICLAVMGVVFIISGISVLSVESIDIDDVDYFDSGSEPLNIAGVIMLLIGGVLVVVSCALCYVGHREYKKFTQGSAGRVINPAPTVALPAGSYPVVSNTRAGQQVPSYQPPTAGQMTPQLPYPGASATGQTPLTGTTAAGQMSYPGAPPIGQMPYNQQPGQVPYGQPIGGQMPYGQPVSGQMAYGQPLAGQMSYGVPQNSQMPYPVPQAAYPGQSDMYGKQQYTSSQPYHMQEPPPSDMASGLPPKGGVPGEVDQGTEYDRPPPYAP